MPANYTRLGALMTTDPTLAHAKLSELFLRRRFIADVAKHVGVDPSTLKRWVARLIALGFKDPRVVRHGERGPDKRPRAKKQERPVAKSLTQALTGRRPALRSAK